MKTSANTHSGLKRNENFASTGKDLRDWPGRTGRGGLVAGRVVGAGLVGARHGIELMLRGEHGMLARGLHGREIVFGQAVVPLACVFLILILACLFV